MDGLDERPVGRVGQEVVETIVARNRAARIGQARVAVEVDIPQVVVRVDERHPRSRGHAHQQKEEDTWHAGDS